MHVAITSSLRPDDPKRFNTGTPAQMLSSVLRTWQVSPTSERIVEDISAMPRRLDRIIEAKGAVVPDLFFRTGRRHIGVFKVELKNKPRKRQRTATNTAKELHPDAQESWYALVPPRPDATPRPDAQEACEEKDSEIGPEEEAENCNKFF